MELGAQLPAFVKVYVWQLSLYFVHKIKATEKTKKGMSDGN